MCVERISKYHMAIKEQMANELGRIEEVGHWQEERGFWETLKR